MRERFLAEVFSCPSLQLMEGDSLADLTQRWRDGKLTPGMKILPRDARGGSGWKRYRDVMMIVEVSGSVIFELFSRICCCHC